MTTIRKNERSWAIELISQINQFSTDNDLIIKRAGGESTVSEHRGQNMFPDVILYGDNDLSSILQGWELKMPDVPIYDADFVHDAQRKARALNLNSCVIWNFTHVKLFVYDTEAHEFAEKKRWDNASIRTRDDVQKYKSRWEKTLKSVLTSVNEYLISGEVKKAFIGDVLTRTSISNLVNENKFSVAAHLRKMATQDAIMGARLETWWKDIKSEYEGDEDDKFPAYSKSVIINWANRIIFAHLIKNRQMSAYAIDSLNYDSTPKDGNNIFKSITEKSDFYNIFAPMPYSDFLPEKTWASLVELSLFLKSTPVKDISQRILQQVLEGSVNISKRLVNGQYPTPPVLASILSRMTIHDVTGDCFDGCCGTGTIPSFIIDYKKSKHIGSEKSMATTWASDKFKLPLQIANLAMTSYDTINIPCRLFQRDILTLHSGDEVEIVNPQTGEKEIYTLPQFDTIISNLPFVKASGISTDDDGFVERIKTRYGLSGRSDFSYYVALHLIDLVKEDGYIGIILSNSFLGTEAGNLFFNAIRDNFDDIKLHISGSGRWFENADVVTVLLVMSKRTGAEKNTNISFFRWNKSLYRIQESCDYTDCIVNSSLLDSELDGSIVARANYSYDSLTELKEMNISYNALFAGLNWLVEIKNKLTPLKSVLNVIRGNRRGYDKLFIPRPDDYSTIEPQFLHNFMKNLKRTRSYVAQADSKAFCCSMTIDELESGNMHGALSWIKRFEDVVDDYGPLVVRLKRAHMEWYENKPSELAEIGTMMNPDDRMFYVKFSTSTFINQRVIGLNRINQNDDINLIHALLNSIISIFYIEAVGFGRGLGALDISKDSISKCYMLNPALLNQEQKTDIMEKFEILMSRGIVDIDQDIEDPVRREFDMAVLNAFGIGRYFDNIVSSLKAMRKVRKAARQHTVELRPLRELGRQEPLREMVIGMAAESEISN